MSTNRKNRDKPILRNLIESNNIPQRRLIVLEPKINNEELRKTADNINEYIQDLNRIITQRNVQYIRIEESKDYYNLDKTRIVLRSETTDSKILTNIYREFQSSEGNTFLVEMYVNDNGYIEIGCTDETSVEPTNLSNFALVDREYLSCALEDVFLDSALFNSYSFLRDLPVSDKREFNHIKVEFLNEQFGDFTKLKSPFYVFNNKSYKYLSMAFFTRISEDEVDLYKLVELWEKFVQTKYPGQTHIEPQVEDQLLSLIDRKQYSKKIINECLKKEKGTYWLLKIKHKINDRDTKKWVQTVMGSTRVGKELIIPSEKYDSIYELVRKQSIAAFKIIVQ